MTGLQDTFMKFLSSNYPLHELQAVRCAMALALITAAGLATGAFRGMTRLDLRPVIVRSLLLGAGSAFFYLSLAAMSLADATAIYFALPLIVAALSGFLIKENVRFWRWLAAIIGFCGVLVTVRPGSTLFEPAAMLTLTATFLYACGNTFTRRISPAVHPIIIAFCAGLGFLTIALALALVFGTGRFSSTGHPSLVFLTRPWVMPTLRDWGLLAGFGIATAAGFFTYAQAYRLAPASFVAPFEYSAMIWAVLFGFLVFGDVPGANTITGSAIIIGAGLLLGWYEARQHRRQLALQPTR